MIYTRRAYSLAQQGADEGRLTVLDVFDLNLSAPVITAVHEYRLRSRQESPSPDKLLAALR
jgi:6-phosphogluconate dehydrogenase (decarboxylating)